MCLHTLPQGTRRVSCRVSLLNASREDAVCSPKQGAMDSGLLCQFDKTEGVAVGVGNKRETESRLSCAQFRVGRRFKDFPAELLYLLDGGIQVLNVKMNMQ